MPITIGGMISAETVGVGTTNLAFQLNEVSMFAKGKKAFGAPTGNQVYDGAKKVTEWTTVGLAFLGLFNPRLNESPGGTTGIKEAANANRDISDLSNKALKHPMNDHMPSRYANQLQYMEREAAEKYLKYKTFFNPSWTEQQVKAALNYGYNSAIKSGVQEGLYTFKYLGENISIYLEGGIFKTGYGDYIFNYEELLKLIGG